MIRCNNEKGSILILVLWAILFLSILAVQIGMTIGQRISLISRIETRNQLRHLTESGIKKAIAALRYDIGANRGEYTPYGKYYRHNNEDLFKDISVGDAQCDVFYGGGKESDGEGQKTYGFVDEERKLNLNVASREEIARLVQKVVTSDEDVVKTISDAVVDWREHGRTILSGFYSDDYYLTLEHPYSPKNADFELPDELMLLAGMTPEIYHQLSPFVTVYGDGLVNINTAPAEVLYALGLNDEVARKVIDARQGEDGVEATVDDHVFSHSYDVIAEMKNFVELKAEDIYEIDQLNRQNKIKTNSFYYLVRATASLRNSSMSAYAVYNTQKKWLEYYREK